MTKVTEKQLQNASFKGIITHDNNNYLVYLMDNVSITNENDDPLMNRTRYFIAPVSQLIANSASAVIIVPNQNVSGEYYSKPLQSFLEKYPTIGNQDYYKLYTSLVMLPNQPELALNFVRDQIKASEHYKKLSESKDSKVSDNKQKAIQSYVDLLVDDGELESVSENPFLRASRFLSMLNNLEEIKNKSREELKTNNDLLSLMVKPQQKLLGIWQGQAAVAGHTATYKSLETLKTFVDSPQPGLDGGQSVILSEVLIQLCDKFKMLEIIKKEDLTQGQLPTTTPQPYI